MDDAEKIVADIIWFNDCKHPNNSVVKASEVIDHVANRCYRIAETHGFHAMDRSVAEALCLIHSEISEALESIRGDNPESTQCPGRSNFSVELADAVIRIFDLAGVMEIPIGEVIIEKMLFNNNRPFMHGKKF